MNEGFNGKAIYNPSGAAGEYSYWACNFFKGCSNMCEYCYLKKGIWVKTLGGDKPELKACLKRQKPKLPIGPAPAYATPEFQGAKPGIY